MSGPAAIEAVLFDFHSTLVDQGDAASWVRHAWREAGRDGDPAQDGDGWFDTLVDWADHVWEHAREIDPDSRRDRGPDDHREVFELTAGRALDLDGIVDATLIDALYRTMLDAWVPYDDTAPVLAELRRRGVRTAVLSNVGIDIRPVLARAGIDAHLDAVVLSYEVGAVKPQPAIFAHTLDALGVAAEHALMVGDSWRDDGGAAQLGVRTLILPRTRGPVHGLDAVLRLIG